MMPVEASQAVDGHRSSRDGFRSRIADDLDTGIATAHEHDASLVDEDHGLQPVELAPMALRSFYLIVHLVLANRGGLLWIGAEETVADVAHAGHNLSDQSMRRCEGVKGRPYRRGWL